MANLRDLDIFAAILACALILTVVAAQHSAALAVLVPAIAIALFVARGRRDA